jgi:ribosomal RNA-processing protein 9
VARWNTRLGRALNDISHGWVQGFTGHKDLVSGVTFREGSSQLFSASFDRSIKLWSVDDRAYMDSLFGHQSEVTALDVLARERCISSGADRTCRLWKIPEETQLIFRASSLTTDCVRWAFATAFFEFGT